MSTHHSAPREPSYYSPTIHAGQQRKQRSIPWDAVSATIRRGEVRETDERHKRVFVARPAWTEGAVGVVVNVRTSDVVTIAWWENAAGAPRLARGES